MTRQRTVASDYSAIRFYEKWRQTLFLMNLKIANKIRENTTVLRSLALRHFNFTNFFTIFFSVSERLTAMKRLSENPQDPQALKQFSERDIDLSGFIKLQRGD